MAVIAGITLVLLLGGSLAGWLVFQSAKDAQSDRYMRLIEVQDDRRDKAESAFEKLSDQYPGLDADAIAEKAEEAQ